MIGRIPNAVAVHSLETRKTAMCLFRPAAAATSSRSPPRAGFVVSAPSSVLAPLLHTGTQRPDGDASARDAGRRACRSSDDGCANRDGVRP
jgi:hypothetical protein